MVGFLLVSVSTNPEKATLKLICDTSTFYEVLKGGMQEGG